ncbi:MAG: IS110 family transposase [Gammaproteobacteria bacterium]|nr:IS110 family transposase [Gammaproteobacteria bacterium]
MVAYNRQINRLGHYCRVVAPSLISTKTGELTSVWVPNQEQEAMRDLTRLREDMKGLKRVTKQRLNAFLLRYSRSYDAGKRRWTQVHFRWMEGLKFDVAVQPIVFQEYIDAVKESEACVAGVEKEMEMALKHWESAPVVEALMALHGVKQITAMTIMAELGDITRFDSPRQLMSFF